MLLLIKHYFDLYKLQNLLYLAYSCSKIRFVLDMTSQNIIYQLNTNEEFYYKMRKMPNNI